MDAIPLRPFEATVLQRNRGFDERFLGFFPLLTGVGFRTGTHGVCAGSQRGGKGRGRKLCMLRGVQEGFHGLVEITTDGLDVTAALERRLRLAVVLRRHPHSEWATAGWH